MTVADSPTRPAGPTAATPILNGRRGMAAQVAVYAFVILPLFAIVLAVPFAWGWGLGWTDVAIAAVFYVISGLGITVGFHRYFTHGSFKAKRPLRIALAVAGMLAMQGPVITWVADHRRHHAFSDKVGDPHSPWLFGTGVGALTKGFLHAHTLWLLDRDKTNEKRFTPDLLADRDIVLVDKLFIVWSVATLLVPAALGGLLTMTWWGAFTAFFWAGLVRVGLLHHVTWSINSICHMIGDQPFASRDHSRNVWPLAILSFGESWHNLHHADPTCARHGVQRGQIDISARVIWAFEKLGWASAVRWPTARRLEKLATRT